MSDRKARAARRAYNRRKARERKAREVLPPRTGGARTHVPDALRRLADKLDGR
jgi:hypothetical protein